MPRTTIEFDVNDRRAREGFKRLQREIQELNASIGDTRRTSETARTGFQQVGQSAGRAGALVNQFGRELNTTQNNTQETIGELDRLQKEFRELQAELRQIQGTGQTDNRGQLISLRTDALQRANADIARYTQLLSDARAVAVRETNPAIQQLERALARSQATANSLTREIELLTDGFRDTTPVKAATADMTNYALALAELQANAQDTARILSESQRNQDIDPNFRAALADSNAYYAERIRQAEAALAKEKEGTDAFNQLQVEIFQLGRQRLAAQRQLENQRTSLLRSATQEWVRTEQAANNTIITGVLAVTQASREATRARLEFAQQIAAIPSVSSPEAQYGNFISQINRDFQESTRQGQGLLTVMRQIANFAFASDLEDRLPNPGVRQQQIDEQIAARGAGGGQTPGDIQIEAYQQGLQFIRNLRQQENQSAERELQTSLREQQRYYRQFTNTVSNLFTGVVTGRIDGFEEVAQQFLAQSLRIVARAFIEFQIQKSLDDQLTASKIANLQKVAAAQGAGGLAGNLPGIGGIGNLGNLFSGGGLALGASALLFPNESRNLLSGIKDEISGFLSNVADAPDRAFGAQQQVYLKIGEGEVRDITDIQDELREENRV